MTNRRSWYTANLINFLGMACHMSATLLPIYWKREGFQDHEIGWIAAGFSLAAIASRLILGYGLERWGRRPFLLLGGAFLTLTAGIFPYLEPLLDEWLAVRVLQGVGLGFFTTTILTWVADQSPPERIGELQGVFGVSGLTGAAVGPWVAETVYQEHGFQAMFSAMMWAGVACFALLLILPESRSKVEIRTPSFSSGLRIWDHRALVAVTLPFGWFVGAILTFIGPYLEMLGLPKVGMYFAGFALASVAIRIFAARLIDSITPQKLIPASSALLILSALSIAALQLAPYKPLLAVAAVLNGFGHGFLFPALSSYVVKRTTPEQRGAGLALFTGSFDLGILLGALASGYVAQASSYGWAFCLAALLLFVSLPVFRQTCRKRASQ